MTWFSNIFRPPTLAEECEADFRYYRKAAERGDVVAALNAGVFCSGRHDYEQAAYWYRKAAVAGNSYAQNNLGWLYEGGRGLPQDLTQAAEWYHKAADQGDSSAQSKLGRMYADGCGVPQDFSQAVKWYRKAAEQGESNACDALGNIYANGRGIPKDVNQAVKWFIKSDNDISKRELLKIYLSGQAVPDRYSEFSVLGGAKAIYNVAKMYENDKVLAAFWTHKAAELGFAEAQFQLGLMYTSHLNIFDEDDGGGVVMPSRSSGQYWHEKAAEQGHIHAAYSRGLHFEEERNQDFVKAYMWFHVAATRTGGGQLSINSGRSRDELAKKMTKSQLAEAQRKFELLEQRQLSSGTSN